MPPSTMRSASLVQLGDSQERVASWLRTLGWEDFKDIEARFRAMVGG